MKISKTELTQVIKEELEAVLTEESADEREDHNIDSLFRYARQNRRALNKLLKEAGHDELEGERPDTDEEAGIVTGTGFGERDSSVPHTPMASYTDRYGETHYGRRAAQARRSDSLESSRKSRGSGATRGY